MKTAFDGENKISIIKTMHTAKKKYQQYKIELKINK